ncbi:DNA internalization-related competence protein ComEC/Rec2 [Piscibacillus halophilus]|uniref:DNA internalization-related competence protein ComEC/Rec2 n=1 Tax=Piscibacillus halophilus TaxID=571933 RepID=UPI0030C6AA34
MKGNWFILSLTFMLGYLPLGVGVLMFTLLCLVWKKKVINNPYLFLMASFSFLLSLIISPNLDYAVEDYGYYEGAVKVISDPEIDGEQLKFIGQMERQKVYFYSNEPNVNPHHGSSCIVKSYIQTPNAATNPGQFNYQQYLANQGILYVSFDTEILKCQGRSFLSHFFEWRYVIQQNIINQISEQSYAWINALLFGQREGLPDDIIKSFQYWGLSHLLAISGLHVGIFLGICYVVLSKWTRLTIEQSKWLILVIIPIYIIIAGAQPPVLRAGLMAIFVIVLSFMKQSKLDVTDILSIVFMVLLIVDPYLMYQLSFQFSFAVTFALILSRKLLKNDSWLMISLKVSLISQLVILPLQFYYFYFTNVLSFAMNLIYVPYFSILVLPFLLSITLSVFIFPDKVVAFLDYAFIMIHEKMMKVILLIGEPSFAQWVVGQPNLVIMVVYGILFLWFMYSWEAGYLKRAGVISILMVGLWYIQLGSHYIDKSLKITVLDVGQAESIVIELPNRSGIYVVDVGEEIRFNSGHEHKNFNDIIKPYLWSKGISRIDGIIISHYDTDHAGSLEQIINHFQPKHIISHPFQSLELSKLVTIQEGMQISHGDVQMKFLSPNFDDENHDENNRSLVFILKYDDFDMLFTGDITNEIEERIAQKYRLDLDVLKVAHHGSNTSTSETLLKETNPHMAIISVGDQNRYGHPDPEVLERLTNEGIRILRTDENGSISIKYVDGHSTLKRFNP